MADATNFDRKWRPMKQPTLIAPEIIPVREVELNYLSHLVKAFFKQY